MPFSVSASACGVALWALILLMSACALTMLAAGLHAASSTPHHAGAAAIALSAPPEKMSLLKALLHLMLSKLAASALQAQQAVQGCTCINARPYFWFWFMHKQLGQAPAYLVAIQLCIDPSILI